MSGLEELAGQVNNVAEQIDFGAANLIKEQVTNIQTTLHSLIGNTKHMGSVEAPIGFATEAADNAITSLAALQEAIRGTANAIVSGGV
ncbi:hypothetical protein [Amycolatopsis aidingensis]|uniref:hypothetical protein n=1 Tax=Amycolatopsis aidingensis TaxID=2842453 RepID=UPI001C0B2894|nr:hypothetical protein [Amycolatopsis aidingensis]